MDRMMDIVDLHIALKNAYELGLARGMSRCVLCTLLGMLWGLLYGAVVGF